MVLTHLLIHSSTLCMIYVIVCIFLNDLHFILLLSLLHMLWLDCSFLLLLLELFTTKCFQSYRKLRIVKIPLLPLVNQLFLFFNILLYFTRKVLIVYIIGWFLFFMAFFFLIFGFFHIYSILSKLNLFHYFKIINYR